MKSIFGVFGALIKCVAYLFLFALVVVLTLPAWIKPVVCGLANRYVPEKVGVAFEMNDFGFNFYTGKLRLGEFRLANPEGYELDTALKFDNISFHVDKDTLFSDVIRIREIRVDGLSVTYLKDDEGFYNFDRIIANVLGEELVKQSEDSSLIDEIWDKAGSAVYVPFTLPSYKSIFGKSEEEVDEEDPLAKKLIIDRVLVSNLAIKYRKMPEIKIDSIEINDIGKEEGGLIVTRAVYEIAKGTLQKGGVIADVATSMVTGTVSGVVTAGNDLITDVVDQVVDSEKLQGAAEKAADKAKALVGSGEKKLENVREAAVGAASNTMGKAVDVTKDIGGDALDLGKKAFDGGLDIIETPLNLFK